MSSGSEKEDLFAEVQNVVASVDLRCKIKEAQFEKADGTQFHPGIHVSNLVITKFSKEKKMDPWRAKAIERKALYGFYEEKLTAPKKSKEEDKYD